MELLETAEDQAGTRKAAEPSFWGMFPTLDMQKGEHQTMGYKGWRTFGLPDNKGQEVVIWPPEHMTGSSV